MKTKNGKTRALPTLRKKIIIISLISAVVLLSLCTTILVGLIFNVLSGYIRNDLIFALQETASNMETQTMLLEDTLQRLRTDETLSAALLQNGLAPDSPQNHSVQSTLELLTDLHAEKNREKFPLPFLDMVYLFDEEGDFASVSYMQNRTSVQETWDSEYKRLYTRFLQSGFKTQIVRARNHINIIYSLYDVENRHMGTVIFGVNENAFASMMQKLDDYPGSFWLLFDERNSRIFASRANPLESADIDALSHNSTDATQARSYRAGYQDYLTHTKQLRMGMGCVLAIPENHFSMLLFESVKYYLYALAGVILLLVLGLILVSVRFTAPLTQMANNLQRVADERFDTKLPSYKTREFNAISSTFNLMLDTINHLINDVYEKKLLVMDSEIKFLQSQMDPHFMFNVLNTIALKAKMDHNEDIYNMASSLAGLTQGRLACNGDEVISIEKELQNAKFYLDLQKYRFEDRFNYFITVQDPALLQAKIPKLILQMIVENAVVHGIEPQWEPGNVCIDISRTDQGVCILVEDDGVGFQGCNGTVALPLPARDADANHNHVALNNAYQLISHFYGAPYGISILSRQGAGTRVTIIVPLT